MVVKEIREVKKNSGSRKLHKFVNVNVSMRANTIDGNMCDRIRVCNKLNKRSREKCRKEREIQRTMEGKC